MWPIFSFAPYIIPLGVGLMQIFRLFGYITPTKGQTQKCSLKIAFEKYFQPLIEFFHMFIGFLIFDTAIVWISGNWTYADWRYQLPSVLLGLFVGSIYLWRAIMIKPNLVSLITKIIFILISVYLIHIHLFNVNRLRNDFGSIFTWFGLMLVIYWIIEIVIAKLNKKESNIKSIAVFLDSSNQYKKFNTLRFDIILYAVALLFAILNFESLSLFAF